jgi:hypothetical protein
MADSPASNPIPLICDRCRAQGIPGAPPFADLGDLLDFAPVPRRPRVGGWDAQAQRAFIAALAVTGSPRQSAAAVGRAQFGVDQLRRAKGSEGFNAAYDRALALAQEKGRHRLAAGMAALVRADAAASRPPLESPRDQAEPPPPAPVTEADRERLRALTLHRALHGDEVPVFHGGRQVGVRRVYNDRLALHHLKEAEEAGGGAARPDWITDPHEIRIARLLQEHPHWTRKFAEVVMRAPNSFIRKHVAPWRWEMLDPWLEQIALARHALRQDLADDPAKAAACETLFGCERDPTTLSEGLAHLAFLLHCMWPEMAEHLDQVAVPAGGNDEDWKRRLRVADRSSPSSRGEADEPEAPDDAPP